MLKSHYKSPVVISLFELGQIGKMPLAQNAGGLTLFVLLLSHIYVAKLFTNANSFMN